MNNSGVCTPKIGAGRRQIRLRRKNNKQGSFTEANSYLEMTYHCVSKCIYQIIYMKMVFGAIVCRVISQLIAIL